jgi:micrococcal nuclease
MKKILLTLLIATSMFAFPAKITKIVDGDTIIVKTPDGKLSKIRFADVDTPEKYLISNKAKYDIVKCGKVTFEMGKDASKHLNTLVKVGDVVEVLPNGTTSKDRDVAVIKIGLINLNKQMVIDGYAYVWHTGRDIKDQSYKVELLTVQDDAIFNKVGLWGTKAREMSCLLDYHK